MSDYHPIDCADYERYELAIMHRETLRVSWQDDAGDEHVSSLLPRDLLTDRGEEFLLAEAPDGDTVKLRLDRIRTAQPLVSA